MGLFNTTKKLSLTLIGLSYLCAAHATDITAIAADFIKTTTTGVTKIDPDVITIDSNDCGRTFSKSGKVFALVQNMECSEGQGDFALQFSGNHNLIFLNTHSITAVDSEPGIGILITGNENHVIGLGKVEGFGAGDLFDGNIVIENAVGNHVSELTLNKGTAGVSIIALDGESAQANHIYNNHVQDTEQGIFVSSEDNSSADANQIHDNRIQGVSNHGIVVSSFDNSSADANQFHDNRIQGAGSIGIFVNSGNNSSADTNQIHDNRIQDVRFAGIVVNSENNSSADANRVHDNHIQDTRLGIAVDGEDNSSADDNQIISNYIIRPAATAISLSSVTANNLITDNLTKEPGVEPVYCDLAADGDNDWGTNFIEFMAPVVSYPGCA